LEKSLE